ncbi:MAG: hypothetical protein SOX61_10760 [Prevotella sp.]|nr:hypothetical protein [Prevotella sp.]
MYEVYYMYKVEHQNVPTIMEKKSLGRSKVYRILRTFASVNPEMAEKMAKQGKDVTPSDYEELLKKVSELESKLKHETLRADFYEEMVAFGKEVYGIDLKKAGTK